MTEESLPEGVEIDTAAQKPPLKATAEQLKRLMDCMELEILPLTQNGVSGGNKVFGAAILREDWSTKLAKTNNEMESPLFHGEVKTIYEWSCIVAPKDRGEEAASSIFFSTHEPCCMCISSIVWSGFQRLFYFFPYVFTKKQGIPHDINIMHELWGVTTYRKQNKYTSSACIWDLVDELDEGEVKEDLKAQIERLKGIYEGLANQYHSEKSKNADNSLAFG